MLWRFGIITQTEIDSLLENENVTLEQILEEDELLQECKAHNRKLIEFLCRPETLGALLKYIVDKPDDNLEETVKYRYPCLAAEVFGCEVVAICEALIRNDALLSDFWKFLDSPDPVNPIQGSYFCRVIGILLQKKTLETIRFIKAQENAVDKILAHIGTSAFMDLLLKLITCEEIKDGEGIVEWLLENGLVAKLVDKLNPELSDEVHLNVGQSIVDILNVVHHYGTKNPVLLQLKNGTVASNLFGHLVNTKAPNHTSALLGGFSILIELVQRALGFVDEGETPDIDFQEEDLTEFMAALEPHLDALHTIMTQKSRVESPDNKPPPVGPVRLKMIEFFIIILHANNAAINKKLLELNVIPCYIDLFFKYQWNNFLHSLVHDMIVKIFSSELDNSHALMLNVLREGHLIDKIVEAAKENDVDVDSRGGARRGYMGHLVLIANHLVKFSQLPDVDKEIGAFFEAENWKEFENSSLAETNQRDNKPLGGHRPVAVSDDMFHSGMDDTSADQFSDDDFEMDDDVIEKPNFTGDGGFKHHFDLDDSDEDELDSPQTEVWGNPTVAKHDDEEDDDDDDETHENAPEANQDWAKFDQANFSSAGDQHSKEESS